MKLVEALNSGVLLGDGANGTLIGSYGFDKQPYDLANVLAPELVLRAHQAYFDAGSDIVETNTFAANALRLEPYQVDAREVCFAGAQLARKAAGEGRLVVGAIGPCGRPLEPIGHVTPAELHRLVSAQALALAEGGVDGFLLETFIDIRELKLAVEAVRSVCDLPIIVSKAYIEDGEMLSDGLPTRCAEEMDDYEGVIAVGANCIVGPQRMLDIVRMIGETSNLPILAYPTPGLPQLVKGKITYDSRPEYFAKAAVRLMEEGARILGGCCGTGPEHIAALRAELGSKPKAVAPRVASIREKLMREPLPKAEGSELSIKLASKKFITAVEMDVPRGLNVEKLVAGAKLLKVHGADIINISDGARARLRMNPSAVAVALQNRVGVEVTMHFSCRDRNLLAIQSDILACHSMGIRNILAVTGDPAHIGDYPSATSVFDIDAVGLVRVLARFNEGLDLAGYSVGIRCGFTIACAYNPNATDQSGEDDRLQQKVDSGADLIYTQPIFERADLDRLLQMSEKVGKPFMVGVLPIRSQRHCEFMHNEVPGIDIPDWLRKRIGSADDDATALEIGIEEAQNLVQLIKQSARGLYLMPPAGNAEIARRVMEA